MGTVASDESGEREDGRKIFALFYGALVYVGVWCILLCIVGFVGNFFGPLLGTKLALVIPFKSIDMGIEEPLWKAVLVDVALVGILGLQHSIMPRPWFKAWITRFVPKHLERGTYIIFAICALSRFMRMSSSSCRSTASNARLITASTSCLASCRCSLSLAMIVRFGTSTSMEIASDGFGSEL